MKSSGIMKALGQYKNVGKILSAAKQERWPYPKTFDLLKEVGVKSYVVKFIGGYDASYYGIDDAVLYKEEPPEGHNNLQAVEHFSADGVKNAIIKHMRDKTSFASFLEDIANAGSSHYIVSMDARTVIYYNDQESQFHAEQVPAWNWDLE